MDASRSCRCRKSRRLLSIPQMIYCHNVIACNFPQTKLPAHLRNTTTTFHSVSSMPVILFGTNLAGYFASAFASSSGKSYFEECKILPFLRHRPSTLSMISECDRHCSWGLKLMSIKLLEYVSEHLKENHPPLTLSVATIYFLWKISSLTRMRRHGCCESSAEPTLRNSLSI